MNFTARLKKEWSKLKQSKAALPPDAELDVDLYPRSENDLGTWTATILGPPDSPFEDHLFKLRLTVPNRYPLMPPKAHFLTKVCHPNVHFKTGEVCLDVLKDQWTPSYTLESVCRTIIQLLSHPAADSPLNCDCGNMIRAGDLAAYHAAARMYTLDFAQPTRQFFEKQRRLHALRKDRVATRIAGRQREQQQQQQLELERHLHHHSAPSTSSSSASPEPFLSSSVPPSVGSLPEDSAEAKYNSRNESCMLLSPTSSLASSASPVSLLSSTPSSPDPIF